MNEDGRCRIGEVDDLPVARSIRHPEGPVEPIGAHVDRRGVSPLARLQAEDLAKASNRLEHAVRETGVVQAIPAPAGGVVAEPAPEKRHGTLQRGGLKCRAGLSRGSSNVVAPVGVGLKRMDHEPGPHDARRNSPELVFRHAREAGVPGGVDRRRRRLRREFPVPGAES